MAIAVTVSTPARLRSVKRSGEDHGDGHPRSRRVACVFKSSSYAPDRLAITQEHPFLPKTPYLIQVTERECQFQGKRNLTRLLGFASIARTLSRFEIRAVPATYPSAMH